jgi:hypothetical protein
MHVKTFIHSLKEIQVIESKRSMRSGEVWFVNF